MQFHILKRHIREQFLSFAAIILISLLASYSGATRESQVFIIISYGLLASSLIVCSHQKEGFSLFNKLGISYLRLFVEKAATVIPFFVLIVAWFYFLSYQPQEKLQQFLVPKHYFLLDLWLLLVAIYVQTYALGHWSKDWIKVFVSSSVLIMLWAAFLAPVVWAKLFGAALGEYLSQAPALICWILLGLGILKNRWNGKQSLQANSQTLV